MPEMHDREADASCSLELRSFDAAQRSAHFICSTDAIDSYGERVEQKWDLTRFQKNPVILYAHNSRELPIGKASNVGVVDGKLQCTITLFSEKANPRAEEVFNVWQEGGLKAVSVGFRSHSYRIEKEQDEEVLILSDNELMEVSVVPIPANPEALGKMRAKARADATEAASRGVEKTMTDEDKKRLADAESARAAATDRAEKADKDAATARASLATAEKALADERTKSATFEARCTALVTERDAAVAKADKAADAALETELRAVLADKATGGKDEEFLALGKTNRSLFDAITATLVSTKRAVPPEPKGAGAAGPHEDNGPAADALRAARALPPS